MKRYGNIFFGSETCHPCCPFKHSGRTTGPRLLSEYKFFGRGEVPRWPARGWCWYRNDLTGKKDQEGRPIKSPPRTNCHREIVAVKTDDVVLKETQCWKKARKQKRFRYLRWWGVTVCSWLISYRLLTLRRWVRYLYLTLGLDPAATWQDVALRVAPILYFIFNVFVNVRSSIGML